MADSGERPAPIPVLEKQAHGGALLRTAGPGRPKGQKDAVLSAIRDALITRDGKGIIPALIRKANEGDTRSIELCLAYGIGKPTEKVEVTGQDGGAIFLAPVLARLSDDELDAAARRIAGGSDDDPAREGEAEDLPGMAEAGPTRTAPS